MKKFFNDMITGIDGITVDPSRILWIVGIACFLSFAGYEVYKNGKFDMTNFGLAYSALLGGGAAAVKIKESSEPKGE